MSTLLKSVQIDLIVVVHACVRRSATVGLRIEIYPQEKKQMYLAFATGNGGQMIEVLIIKSFKTSKKKTGLKKARAIKIE